MHYKTYTAKQSSQKSCFVKQNSLMSASLSKRLNFIFAFLSYKMHELEKIYKNKLHCLLNNEI